MCGKGGVCMAKGGVKRGMHGKAVHAWQRGGMHGKGGHAWQRGEACMVCMPHLPL